MTTTRVEYLKIAAKELGYYSPRPKGKSKYGIWYGDLSNVKDSSFDAAPWCAMFLSWVAMKAGATDIIPVHAYTPSGVNWFKARKQWYTSPRVGDIVYYRFSGTRVHHVGVVEVVHPDGSITAIEGNTSGTSGGSQRNGGMVSRKRRRSGIVGYGRPKYSTSTSTSPAPTRGWLQRGDKGPAVKAMQERLVVHGYKITVDADFGPASEKAVKDFQKSKKLIVDGLAGKDTMAALNAAPPVPAKPAPTPTPDPKPTTPTKKTVPFWAGLANVGGYEDNTGTSKNAKVGALLKKLSCSMIFLNEAIYSSQTVAYKKALGSGYGHDGSSYGNDVYYTKSKFKLESSHSFQIPGIAQKNRSVERIRWSRDGAKFTTFLTHMPHGSRPQREVAAKYVIKLVNQEQKDRAIIIVGDFNCETAYTSPNKSPRYIFEQAGFKSSRAQAKNITNGTVNEMHDRKPEGRGYWISDAYTRGCEITDVRLVETSDSLLDHDWFQYRIVVPV